MIKVIVENKCFKFFNTDIITLLEALEKIDNEKNEKIILNEKDLWLEKNQKTLF